MGDQLPTVNQPENIRWTNSKKKQLSQFWLDHFPVWDNEIISSHSVTQGLNHGLCPAYLHCTVI